MSGRYCAVIGGGEKLLFDQKVGAGRSNVDRYFALAISVTWRRSNGRKEMVESAWLPVETSETT